MATASWQRQSFKKGGTGYADGGEIKSRAQRLEDAEAGSVGVEARDMQTEVNRKLDARKGVIDTIKDSVSSALGFNRPSAPRDMSKKQGYADGGRVDTGGFDYADNSGGTWGAMGSRALSQARDDAATDSINRTTAETVTAYDDKTDLTDSFKSAPEPERETPSPARSGGSEAADDKARTTAPKRAAPKKAADTEDQVSRRAAREQRERAKDYGDEAARMARRHPDTGTRKHKMLPVVENEMPGATLRKQAKR